MDSKILTVNGYNMYNIRKKMDSKILTVNGYKMENIRKQMDSKILIVNGYGYTQRKREYIIKLSKKLKIFHLISLFHTNVNVKLVYFR